MKMPFDKEAFLSVFAQYNESVWPTQVLLYGIGLAVVLLAIRSSARASAAVPYTLAFLWTWMAVVYHFLFFRPINPAATLFGIAFLVQASLFILWQRRTSDLLFRPTSRARFWIGSVILIYALLGYPLLNFVFGHEYPRMPTFGLPCPTTLLTIGLLIWADPRPHWWLWIVPLAWAGIGTTAALRLSMTEDLALPVAGLVALSLMVASFRRVRVQNS